MNLFFGALIDHVHRPLSVRAQQTWRGAEQSADQRALVVDLAAVLAQMRAAQLGEGGIMLGLGLHRQPRHFGGRCGHRSAAIVAADDAGEARDATAQIVDLSIQSVQCGGPGNAEARFYRDSAQAWPCSCQPPTAKRVHVVNALCFGMSTMRTSFVFRYASALVLGMPAFAMADNAVVGTGTPASCNEAALNAAINVLYPGATAPGGSLTFNCGAGAHTIALTTQKFLREGTVVDGGDKITLDGQNLTRIFNVVDDLSRIELYNITLARGRAVADFGGAILVNPGTSLLLDDVVIRDSRADLTGGAIAAHPGAGITIRRSRLLSNHARDGGAIASSSDVTLENSLFFSNSAEVDQGGALQIWLSTLNVRNTRFEFNDALNGGAILQRGGGATLNNAVFIENQSRDRGGAYHVYEGGTAVFNDSLFSINSAASDGGALYVSADDIGPGPLPGNFGSTAAVGRSRFEHNTAAQRGGAIYVFGPPPGNGSTVGQFLMQDSIIFGNSADDGGGIYAQGAMSIRDSQIINNQAAFNGGGVYLAPTHVPGAMFQIAFNDFHTTVFSGNTSGSFGGGLYANNAFANYGDVNFVSNSSAGAGGAVAIVGFSLPLSSASFIDNASVNSSCGGALFAQDTGPLLLQDVTFSGNRVPSSARLGGDVCISKTNPSPIGVDLTIEHGTLYGTTAASSVHADANTTVNFVNSIVIGFGAATCSGSGAIVSGGGNAMPPTCNPALPGDTPISSVGEVALSPLSNHGSFTYAHIPLVGSPLIDRSACSAGRNSDQRDFEAPQDGDGNGSAICDTGAIERQPAELMPDIVLFKNGFE